MLKLTNLFAIVSVTIVLCYSVSNLASAQRPLSSLYELYEAGRTLESAQNQVADEDQKTIDTDSRNKLLFLFVREPKSDASDRFFHKAEEVVDQFRIKGANFIADNKKQQGWFGNIMRGAGPLNGLRSISRSYPHLREAVERYAQHVKVDSLSEEDIECDVVKFQIETLNSFLFVLQTDIKYLATEQSALVNIAIFRQLKEARFVATNNFYSIKELTPDQRQLLKNFFLDRVDQESTTVGEAVDHFDEPSSLVLGRLHDSCHSLLAYADIWAELEPKRQEVCTASKLANKREDQGVFSYQLEDYEPLVAFCRPFLDSL